MIRNSKCTKLFIFLNNLAFVLESSSLRVASAFSQRQFLVFFPFLACSSALNSPIHTDDFLFHRAKLCWAEASQGHAVPLKLASSIPNFVAGVDLIVRFGKPYWSQWSTSAAEG
jgi:hypothetical protein